MKKIYVVMYDSGLYDDAGSEILAIYENLIEAENRKQKVLNQSDIDLNTPCPVSEDWTTHNDYEAQQYANWYNNHYQATEFSGCRVVEYDLL